MDLEYEIDENLKRELDSIDLDKMTDAERIRFQNKYNVLVFNKRFGFTEEDFREYRGYLANAMDPNKPQIAFYNRQGLAEWFPKFFRPLSNGVVGVAFNTGKTVVLPDSSKFKDEGHEAYTRSIDISAYLNEKTIKKHKIVAPDYGRNK